MRFKLFMLAIASATVATGVSAQTARYQVTVAHVEPASGYQKLHIAKAAVGSTPIRVWANTAIDPDCSVHEPGATLTLLEPPAHGLATIRDEPYFAAFPPANPRSACNAHKVPGHQAYYTAAAGYVGHDRLMLQGASPDGAVRRITVDVTVRQAPPGR
ncbi:hypothetical protein [Caulobacter sp. UC70_42]|uniref:hypothetical protein n=1 Tax=Caulobacter sp. UC70_42 TaxID=3374551 RepID=UPI003756531A